MIFLYSIPTGAHIDFNLSETASKAFFLNSTISSKTICCDIGTSIKFSLAENVKKTMVKVESTSKSIAVLKSEAIKFSAVTVSPKFEPTAVIDSDATKMNTTAIESSMEFVINPYETTSAPYEDENDAIASIALYSTTESEIYFGAVESTPYLEIQLGSEENYGSNDMQPNRTFQIISVPSTSSIFAINTSRIVIESETTGSTIHFQSTPTI